MNASDQSRADKVLNMLKRDETLPTKGVSNYADRLDPESDDVASHPLACSARRLIAESGGVAYDHRALLRNTVSPAYRSLVQSIVEDMREQRRRASRASSF
jgi:hypothetical protein